MLHIGKQCTHNCTPDKEIRRMLEENLKKTKEIQILFNQTDYLLCMHFCKLIFSLIQSRPQ